MKPGPPALCRGTVSHHRHSPKAHGFHYDVAFVWFDPDCPDALTDLHWAWSSGRFRPARIAAADYGWPDDEQVRPWIQRLLAGVDPNLVAGEIRFLTQPRRWGWLFNPISLYLIWPPGAIDRPIGAVLEVTNTPWKERHQYAVALDSVQTDDDPEATAVGATFGKDLHVSPFLPLDMTYHLRVSEPQQPTAAGDGRRMNISILVSDPAGDIVLETALNLDRRPATRRNLAETLRQDGFPTHRTSGGIHHQAARLLAKGIPFVPHPKRSTSRGSS